MKQRLVYVDCMRGIAMLMVIFCHVEVFCFGIQEKEIIASAISIPMLSNFFFISGLFTPPLLSYKQLKKRVLYLILPTITMFLLYVGAYYGNYAKLIECVGGEYKWGYWFTFVLFLMNVIHCFVSMVYAKCRKQETNSKETIILLPLVIIAILLHILKNCDWNYNEAFYCRWLGLRLLAEHFPYYVLGIACCIFRSKWHRLINNEWIIGATVVVFVGLQIHSGGGFYKALLIGLLGIYLLYEYCFAYQDTLSEQTLIGRHLSLIGRYTQPIYLIHYFFILGLKMPWIGEHLDPACQWWIIAILSAIMTLVITYSSLMVRKMLSISTLLYRILLGK